MAGVIEGIAAGIVNQIVNETPMESPPESPCIDVCVLDENDVCTGCLRTLDEIAGWSTLGAAGQWRVVEAVAARRRRLGRDSGVG